MTFIGSKGGGGSTFKQTPDNLRSEDTFEGVLGLALGPLKGPRRGLKSIKVDGTAIENETGELNFKDFIATFANGDPLAHPQKVALRLGAGASPQPVNLTFSNDNGSNPLWITKTLPNTNANYIDLRFVVSQLFRQTSKGIFNETATLEIEMKPTGSTTWVNPTIGGTATAYKEEGYDVEDTFLGNIVRAMVPRSYFNAAGTGYNSGQNYRITGKTTGPSVYELRIGVPNTGNYANVQWDVRVRLLERDTYDNGLEGEDNIQEKRTVAWESLAAVYSGALGDKPGWQGVAWLQLYGKASDQLTGVPEVEGEYDTKIVPVPPATLFNPETRIWTPGIWDGSWEYAYTNDPAWAISDLISDSLGGISAMAPGSYLNKWDAREASQWFSEQVPDGDAGTHPRFSMNLAITDKQKAPELVRYLAGAVGGLAWDNGEGEWRLKVDKPENAVDIFTLENVEGEFNYSHTDVDTRFNDITGKFLNEEMDYREDSVRLFDNSSNSSIARIGRKPTTIALVGCTNRQEAMRRVMMRLRSACRETRIVNFVTNRRGKNIAQLNHILIADASLGDSEQRTTGRVVDISANRQTITVRDNLRVEAGVEYWVNFSLRNPDYNPNSATQPTSPDWTKPLTVQRIRLNNASPRGNVTSLLLDQALPADAAEYLVVALEAVDLPTVPKMYRVLSIETQDDGERMAISAMEVDTGKWDAVDNVSKEDAVHVDLRGQPAQPLLQGGQMLSLVTIPGTQGANINLQAQWQRPADRRIAGVRVRYRVNDGNWIEALPRTQLTDFGLVNPAPGFYEFELTSVGRDGVSFSRPLTETFEVTQTLIDVAFAEWSRITGPGKPDDNADVTAVSMRRIEAEYPVVEIKEGNPGHTGTRLVNHVPFSHTTVLAGGAWSIASTNLNFGTVTINAATGEASISGILESGAYIVRYTHTDGVPTDLPVNITYLPAAATTPSAKTKSTTSNTGANSDAWSQVISMSITDGPLGRLFFNKFGCHITPSSATGTADFRARLLVNGVERAVTVGQEVVAGGNLSFADFSQIFEGTYDVPAGTTTIVVELERTSGTGTILVSNNGLDCTIIAS